MTTIVNAYSGNESVANSLKSIADSMFGDQSHRELYRQEALKYKRENEAADAIPGLYQSGDYRGVNAQILRHSPTASNLGGVNLAGAGLDAKGNYNDPRLATAALGAGHSAEGTMPGLGMTIGGQNQRNAATIAGNLAHLAATPHDIEDENGNIVTTRTDQSYGRPAAANVTQRREAERNNARLASEERRASEATRRTAETQTAIAKRQDEQRQWEDQHTLVDIVSPDGAYTLKVPKSDVPAYQAKGYHGGMSMDQRKSELVRQQLQPGAPPGFSNPLSVGGQPQNLTGDIIPPGGTRGSAPAAPEAPADFNERHSGNAPPGYMHPLVQEALGYPRGATSYQHLQSGAIGQSYDGGVTIGGHPAGAGWVQITPQEAITGTRENNDIAQAHKPLPVPPGQYSQAARDAEKTSNLGSMIQHDWNAVTGAIGGGEVGADTNRARESLAQKAAFAREVLLSTPGRATNQAQHWANDLIPQPGWSGMTEFNATTAKNKVVSLTQQLRRVYDMEATEAQDRNTDPKLRRDLLAHMVKLRRTIEQYEEPVQGAAPAPQSEAEQAQQAREAAAARQRGARSPGPAQQPAAAAQTAPQPPMAGARQAPDGHWYVEQGGKFFRVEP